MNLITLDFETYYDKVGRNKEEVPYTLKHITTEEYVRSPKFETIGVAVKLNDEPAVWYSGPKEYIQEKLNQYDWGNSYLLCHNTAFDAFILSHHYKIHPKYYLDTMLMATPITNGSVSLAALAEKYEVGVKGNEVIAAAGKQRADFFKSELEEYGRYCCNDVELTYRLFQKLKPLFPPKELLVIDLTLRMFINPSLLLDRHLLQEHLQDVVQRKANLLTASGISNEDIMSNPKFAQVLQANGVEPPKKISKTTGKETYAFAKTDDGLNDLLDHPNPVIQAVVAARLGGKSTIEETRTKRLIGISERGSLPVPLRYYGAKTGRWSAEGKINMQNLPRGSKIRAAIKAPSGYKIVGADLSNIELRVGLWLAGQDEALDLLRAGKDLYRDFGSKVYNKPTHEITADERFVSKTASLALIYGTGADKLFNTVKTISKEQADDIVSLYRSEYDKVKAIWSQGSRAIKALLEGNTMEMGREGFFQVSERGILLPSGLYMKYPGLHVVEGEKGPQYFYLDGKKSEKLYGAKVFQGLTQATARCILADQMCKISRRYPIALSIHDALYLVVKEGEATSALEFMQEIMRTPPPWMPTIPLSSEGAIGDSLADV